MKTFKIYYTTTGKGKTEIQAETKEQALNTLTEIINTKSNRDVEETRKLSVSITDELKQ